MLKRVVGLAAVITLGLGVAGESLAEIRRVEAVGVVPLKPRQQGSVDALDQAVHEALREAVSQVARDFLMEAEPREGEEVDLQEVLGERMVPYTARFRILDDQGERPAMFAEDPTVTTEYVVEVEVFVDADRVQQRLVDAGLVAPDPGVGLVSRIELEIRGLSGYGAYEAVRTLLTEQLGAHQALPRSFERGIAVLDVELAGKDADATSLAEQLLDLGTPELTVHPVEMNGGRLVITVDWSPPTADDGDPAASPR
jgi:hypothetical protein